MDPGISTLARAVFLNGNTVAKRQTPSASRRERLRTLAGTLVGRQTSLFVVPEIVSFDDAAGEIVFERLPLASLREAISSSARGLEMAQRVARSLAAIHSLMLSDEGATAMSAGQPGFSRERGYVPLHGDFALSNVLYLRDSDQIAIIDWSTADWIGIEADLGPPEIDVAVFLRSLFHRSLLDRTPRDQRRRVASHFLATYASISPHGLDLGSLDTFLAATGPAFVRMTRRQKGTLRALGYRHAMFDLRSFLRQLTREGLSV